MRENIRRLLNTKEFHIGMVIFIIVIILFIAGAISLKYNVEGEANLPFELSKISIISSVEGTDNEDTQNKWNLTLNQNNDIYLYIKKNDNYKNTEIIQSIVLDNFNIQQSSEVGQKKLFKPDSNIDTVMFKNTEENVTDKIEYKGDLDSSIKDLKISNQGGLVVFRYANTNIGNYVSNDDEEINHQDLLKKLNINNDDLKTKVTFDITIKLESNKNYKASVELELPVDNVVDGGTQSKEIVDLDNVIFKRVNNVNN